MPNTRQNQLDARGATLRAPLAQPLLRGGTNPTTAALALGTILEQSVSTVVQIGPLPRTSARANGGSRVTGTATYALLRALKENNISVSHMGSHVSRHD